MSRCFHTVTPKLFGKWAFKIIPHSLLPPIMNIFVLLLQKRVPSGGSNVSSSLSKLISFVPGVILDSTPFGGYDFGDALVDAKESYNKVGRACSMLFEVVVSRSVTNSVTEELESVQVLFESGSFGTVSRVLTPFLRRSGIQVHHSSSSFESQPTQARTYKKCLNLHRFCIAHRPTKL